MTHIVLVKTLKSCYILSVGGFVVGGFCRGGYAVHPDRTDCLQGVTQNLKRIDIVLTWRRCMRGGRGWLMLRLQRLVGRQDND